MVPDFQSFIFPVLRLLSQVPSVRTTDVYREMVDYFNLSESDQNDMLPSGKQERYKNRAAWALKHLEVAGLLIRIRKGEYKITDRGISFLKTINGNHICIKDLEIFESYKSFRSKKSSNSSSTSNPKVVSHTEKNEHQYKGSPEETLESAYQELLGQLSNELLQTISVCSPKFFERVVIDLLVGLGYGGGRSEAGKAFQTSNDGGVDGVIKEDLLGLDNIYVQAKKWEDTVGRPEIQKFAGALQGVKARKGVFITTSKFSSSAIEYASQIELKIILIDGITLAKYMIEAGVGVSDVDTYTVKTIDSDYFIE